MICLIICVIVSSYRVEKVSEVVSQTQMKRGGWKCWKCWKWGLTCAPREALDSVGGYRGSPARGIRPDEGAPPGKGRRWSRPHVVRRGFRVHLQQKQNVPITTTSISSMYYISKYTTHVHYFNLYI